MDRLQQTTPRVFPLLFHIIIQFSNDLCFISMLRSLYLKKGIRSTRRPSAAIGPQGVCTHRDREIAHRRTYRIGDNCASSIPDTAEFPK